MEGRARSNSLCSAFPTFCRYPCNRVPQRTVALPEPQRLVSFPVSKHTERFVVDAWAGACVGPAKYEEHPGCFCVTASQPVPVIVLQMVSPDMCGKVLGG